MKIAALLSILIIYCLGSNSLLSENGGTKEIRLKYADSLVGSNTPGVAYRDFFGNVQLQHGDVDVRSDFAKQFLESNKVDLIGNVIIKQKLMTLKSPKIFYDGNTSIARAFNGVIIEDEKSYLRANGGIYNTKTFIAEFEQDVYIVDDSARIFSDYIVYNRMSRRSFAYGNVWILGKHTNSILKSDTLINTPNDNYSFATGNPILYQIDSNYSKQDTTFYSSDSLLVNESYLYYDTLSIKCDTMHAYRQLFNEKYVFLGNVEIVRGSVTATANEAVFYKDEDYVILKGNPIVWYNSTQLYADSIIIRLPNKELKAIEAYSNSIAISSNDTISKKRLDQIMGDKIIIDIDSGKVSGITSIGEAKSLYFFRDAEGESGLDIRTTDTIHVEFAEGEIENIIWLGMTFSEFFPETFVFGKEESFYLPLFNWNENKPKKVDLKLPKQFIK